MRFSQSSLFVVCGFLLLARIAGASEEKSIPEAVKRGSVALEKSGDNWKKNKTCFSCHHQTMPMFGLVEAAGQRDTKNDAKWLKMQANLTHEFFKERIETMKKGNHIGGGATSVAFGLWALYLDDRKDDETSHAMIRYLLHVQHKEGYWFGSCNRPPMQQSNIAATVMVLQYAPRFANKDQRDELEKASEKAMAWLEKAPLKTQEDRVWRLWGLYTLGKEKDTEKINAIRKTLSETQRKDGGWNQTGDLKSGKDEQESDAYSTGQTLFILRLTGSKLDDTDVTKATDYLLKNQAKEGTWHVKTRVKPVQADFDNGDPHGKDQFLSIAATSWAVAGLAKVLPKK